ncbi:hypothetical protein [Mechercharimyces sp. CAU 1602]|nr:hypothetical protein [Mechercharimyces sp. CAU 1602]MCS1350915.1 hypothetical protein [Mechercharimyces sp. CAU 1602]
MRRDSTSISASAITKSLVELHQGHIGIRARADGKRGSEFWFTLPYKEGV